MLTRFVIQVWFGDEYGWMDRGCDFTHLAAAKDVYKRVNAKHKRIVKRVTTDEVVEGDK